MKKITNDIVRKMVVVLKQNYDYCDKKTAFDCLKANNFNDAGWLKLAIVAYREAYN